MRAERHTIVCLDSDLYSPTQWWGFFYWMGHDQNLTLLNTAERSRKINAFRVVKSYGHKYLWKIAFESHVSV